MSRTITVAALALAGTTAACASTNHILASDVDEVFHSTNPPAVVAACLSHRNGIRAIELPDGARVVAFRNGYGGVARTYSIYPEGTGSRIESRHNFIAVGGKWKRCVGLEPMRSDDAGEVSRP